MKNSLLFLLLLASLTVFSQSKNQAVEQSSIIPIFDSVYHWIRDVDNVDFEYDNREINKVYQDNNLISEVIQVWNGNTWENINLLTIAYDERHNEIYRLIQVWTGSEWINGGEYTCTYNENNQLISRKNMMWYETGWKNGSLVEFEYNDHGDLLSEYRQYGDSDGVNWIPDYLANYTYNENDYLVAGEYYTSWNLTDWGYGYKFTYTYDLNGNSIEYLYMNWNGTDWTNNSKINYSYDNANNMIAELIQTWDNNVWENTVLYNCAYDENNHLIEKITQTPFNNQWANSGKLNFTYDANYNLVQKTGQSWKNGAWKDNYQEISNYDEDDNLTSWLSQNWEDTAWIPNQQYLYTYDANNNQTSKVIQNWDSLQLVTSYVYIHEFDENNFLISMSHKTMENDGIEIRTADSTHYYFKTVLGMEEFPSDLTCMKLFPNPGKDYITIAIPENVQFKYSKLEIFDLKGQNIYIQSITDNLTKVNVGHFAPGLYAVKINCGGKISTMKFLKE
jgi:hypothetical protein